jgi:hypothetical protein
MTVAWTTRSTPSAQPVRAGSGRVLLAASRDRAGGAEEEEDEELDGGLWVCGDWMRRPLVCDITRDSTCSENRRCFVDVDEDEDTESAGLSG